MTHQSKDSQKPDRWFLHQNPKLGLSMFASDEDLKVLASSKTWFADGTFDMSPKEFEQMYFIHVEYKGEPMPIVYCFLKTKKTEAYLEVFRVISRNLDRIMPPGMNVLAKDMMMDFETAERKAFSQIFPGIRVRGCTFHYGHALLRNIGFIGLKLQYADENSLVRAWVRELLALPFLPSFLVGDAWEIEVKHYLRAMSYLLCNEKKY